MEAVVMAEDTDVHGIGSEDGENLAIIPVDADVTLDVFTGISETQVTKEQSAILLADANPDELDILPTGEVYPPQVMVRRRLVKAFGAGGWAMRPLSKPKVSGVQLAQEWALYANGRFLSYTVGGANYQPNNARFTWSDATESLKSNALVRLCKDLGMFSECWDRRWTEEWKRKYTFHVWVEDAKQPQWRRMDREPFYKEKGLCDDSPNKDKYQASKKSTQPQKHTQQPPVQASKPSDNGSQAPKPEPVAPTPPTPVITPEPEKKAEPEKAPVSELDEHFGTPKITAKPEMARFWDGEKWVEKPAYESIKLATGSWFVKQFMGEGKAFDKKEALFGAESQKDITKRGHLGKHYGRTDFVNPKNAMNWLEFSELVAFAWWKQGVIDEGKGTLSLPRYQEKMVEDLKKQGAIPYDTVVTTVKDTAPEERSEAPSVAEIRELGKTVGVNIDDLAADVLGINSLSIDDNDVTPTQRMALWNVATFVNQNLVTDPTCNSIKSQRDLLKIELGITE